MVVVPVVVASLVALPGLRSALDELGDARETNLRLTTGQAQVQGGAVYGARTDFIDWVRARMRAGDSYHLPPIPGRQPAALRSAIRQWSTYQLTPHLLVGPGEADWLILYGRLPGAGFPTGSFGPPRKFDDGLYLLKRRDAG